MDQSLSWKDQCNKVFKSVSSNIALFRRIKCYLPLSARKTFYNGFILPHFDYCSVIWDGCSDIQRLVKLQKRFVRLVMDADHRTSTATFFQTLGILPLMERFKFRKASMVYKSLNGYGPPYMRDLFTYVKDVHGRNTRSSENGILKVPNARKAAYRKSIAVAGSKLFNSVPKEIRDKPNPAAFKSSYMHNFYRK